MRRERRQAPDTFSVASVGRSRFNPEGIDVALNQSVQVPETSAVFNDRHYSVAEVAAMWNLSKDVVRKIFRHEPGVLAIGDPNPRGRRGYVTLRIPQTVLERKYRQMSLSKQYQKKR